jgi:trk system potassium uptake protein
MKCIVIGLGVFGSSLAEKLTRLGHEVIGVDSQMDKVEALKGKVTHTVCLNSTDPNAVAILPLKDTDIVIIGIGEDQGANIMTTALMKQLKVKRLISRSISPLHGTILEAMGIEEIVKPEEESAERWAKKLNIRGVIDSFELVGDNNIVEALVPSRFVGKALEELDIRQDYHVIVLTTIKIIEEKNIFGTTRKIKKSQEVASSKTVLGEGDIMVLYGQIRDIEALLRE